MLVLAPFVLVSCADSGLAGPDTSPSRLSEAAAQEASEEIPSLDAIARYVTPPAQNGAQKVKQTIGPAGGTIRLYDFEVVIPPGAVDRATSFEIKILPEQARGQHAWAQFKPHNQKFAVPVILRVPYSTTESAGADAHVLWWNIGSWMELQTTVTPDGRLETTTDHFSTYGTQRARGITVIGG
jgi:hypothetical protein